MPLWPAYAAVVFILVTTAIIYPIDAAAMNGALHWVHLSGLLNGGCSDSIGVLVAAGIGNFGYGLAFVFIGEAFRRVYWADDLIWKYRLGLLSVLAFYLVLGFPTGRSTATDAVHHISTAVGAATLFVYAVWSLDRRKHPIAFVQNFATFAMLLTGVALFVTYLTGEIDKMGWNGFVASQLAYGLAFLTFLMAWGTMRNGPRRPRKE